MLYCRASWVSSLIFMVLSSLIFMQLSPLLSGHGEVERKPLPLRWVYAIISGGDS
jgi:hypothetical protein